MKFKKGDTFRYKSSKSEIKIIKGSGDRINGILKVSKDGKYIEMSVDFLLRQYNFGFIEIITGKPKTD